jgi:hypothetical protein
MGVVACERHGTHPGLLSCDHVSQAVANSAVLPSVDNYRFDLTGDGTTVLDHMICGECAARFGLSPSELISESVWEDERRFPYVCPVCAACFLEWRNGVQDGVVPNA